MTPDTTSDRARWAALYVLCAGVLMIVLDATIVNVALPSIQEDLGFEQSGLAWVVNAYLVAFGGLLLLSGRLGDLLGQRRVFLAGLVVFTAASVACAAAQTQAMLVIARFVQGAGGAMSSAVVLGMIVTMFPGRREQAKAIGVYGFVASGGASIGLLAGGVLTDALDWHWIFLVNVPVGAVTVALALRLVDGAPGSGFGAGADLPGAALLTGGLMLGVYAILTRSLLLGGAAALLLAAFVARQARVATPLMPLRLFREANVWGANAVQALVVVGMFGMFFLLALSMQQVLGYGPLQVGLAFLPSTVAMGVMSLKLSEPLASRFGAKAVLLPGLAAIGLGVLLLARVPVDAVYARDILPPMVLLGLGAGTAFPALSGVAMADVAPHDTGLASGLVNTSVQVGGAIGLAVLATLAEGRTEALVAAGTAAPQALVEGHQLAYLVGAALVFAAFVLAAAVLRSPEAEHEQRHSGCRDDRCRGRAVAEAA